MDSHRSLVRPDCTRIPGRTLDNLAADHRHRSRQEVHRASIWTAAACENWIFTRRRHVNTIPEQLAVNEQQLAIPQIDDGAALVS